VHVPFVDLGPTTRLVKGRVLARIAETMDRGDFTYGEAVGEFERRFAAYVGRSHCVGVSNVLDGLRLALLASGLREGDGVVVPAATFEVVLQPGGRTWS
jgi:dTDP-4-amino-4,6-dideoxygalactose transaminase